MRPLNWEKTVGKMTSMTGQNNKKNNGDDVKMTNIDDRHNAQEDAGNGNEAGGSTDKAKNKSSDTNQGSTVSLLQAATAIQNRVDKECDEIKTIVAEDQSNTNPKSVIPDGLRNTDCPDGIIAQGKDFIVIQNHGTREGGGSDQIFHQFRFTCQINNCNRIPKAKSFKNYIPYSGNIL